MKVGSNAGPYRPSGPAGVRRSDGVGAYDAAKTSGAQRSFNDRIDILGIPTDELTPNVHTAILSLMEEVEVLKRDLGASNARLRELEDLADMDPLLPINNRRAFVRELRRMISFADRYGTPSTLMFIDMNDMKLINDSHGHEAGDAALFHLAQMLTANTRGTDVVGRLGGDEFGVIMAQADVAQGTEKAQLLYDIITTTPLHLEGADSISLRLAYGLHTFHGQEVPEEALEKADQAMYAHKKEIKGADKVR